MDIKVQTKISVLLEKIHYLNLSIQQHGDAVNKLDKDLLTNYVRELYELVLTLPVQTSGYPDPSYLHQAGYQQPVYPAPSQQPPYPSPAPNGFYLPNASPIGHTQASQQQPAPPQSQHQQQSQGVNGNYGNNGTPQPTQPQPSTLNPAFSYTNGKRTLSESIRIKTGETEKPSLNEQFRKSDNKDIAAKLQLTPIKDLKTFIGLNKRFSYINFLFGNDANLYDDAIEKLNSSSSRQAAMDYLDNHLRPKLKWSDDNEMVNEFYQLVERRYLG